MHVREEKKKTFFLKTALLKMTGIPYIVFSLKVTEIMLGIIRDHKRILYFVHRR